MSKINKALNDFFSKAYFEEINEVCVVCMKKQRTVDLCYKYYEENNPRSILNICDSRKKQNKQIFKKLVKLMERSGFDIDEDITRDLKADGRARVELGCVWAEVEFWDGYELAFNIIGYYFQRDEVKNGEKTTADLFLEDVNEIRARFPRSRILHIGALDPGGHGKLDDPSTWSGDGLGGGFDYHKFRGTKKTKT